MTRGRARERRNGAPASAAERRSVSLERRDRSLESRDRARADARREDTRPRRRGQQQKHRNVSPRRRGGRGAGRYDERDELVPEPVIIANKAPGAGHDDEDQLGGIMGEARDVTAAHFGSTDWMELTGERRPFHVAHARYRSAINAEGGLAPGATDDQRYDGILTLPDAPAGVFFTATPMANGRARHSPYPRHLPNRGLVATEGSVHPAYSIADSELSRWGSNAYELFGVSTTRLGNSVQTVLALVARNNRPAIEFMHNHFAKGLDKETNAYLRWYRGSWWAHPMRDASTAGSVVINLFVVPPNPERAIIRAAFTHEVRKSVSAADRPKGRGRRRRPAAPPRQEEEAEAGAYASDSEGSESYYDDEGGY